MADSRTSLPWSRLLYGEELTIYENETHGRGFARGIGIDRWYLGVRTSQSSLSQWFGLEMFWGLLVP